MSKLGDRLRELATAADKDDLRGINMGYLKDLLYPSLRVLEGEYKLPLMALRVDFFKDALYVGDADRQDVLLCERRELEDGLTLKQLGSREEGRLRKFCASYAKEHTS